MELTRALLTCLCLAAALSAQGGYRDPDALEQELASREQQFAKTESRLQRLHELRVRLDLGLPVHAESYFTLTAEQRELVRERGRDRLLAEESEVQRLSMQATRISEQIDAMRAESRPQPPGDGSHTVHLDREPLLPVAIDDYASAATDDPGADAPDAGARPPMPIFEPFDDGEAEAEAPPEHSRVIAGSTNHAAVGRVLLRAGERLLERASRAEGEKAAELRARALKQFEMAKRELEHVTTGEEPELVNVFRLARCEEKLGNYAAADSLYAQVISRDHKVMPDGTEEYGKWGRAAQASKSVLRWMQDTSGWKPVFEIGEIEWEKR